MILLFDNFNIDVTGEDLTTLQLATAILQKEVARGFRVWQPGEKIWHLDDKPTKNIMLSFLKYENKDYDMFPAPINPKEIAEIGFKWLKNQVFPKMPDIDGDCHAGWRLFTSEHPDSLINIEPAWCLYGK